MEEEDEEEEEEESRDDNVSHFGCDHTELCHGATAVFFFVIDESLTLGSTSRLLRRRWAREANPEIL